jgi:hypothetical protein
VETIAIALFLLLAVVVSGAFARMSPVPPPLPLVQIALGSIIASVAHLGVALKPDIFFLLFLPPLLFLDGWRIPTQGLFRDKGTILELALGLVVFTDRGYWFLYQLDDPGDAGRHRLRARRDRFADGPHCRIRNRCPRTDPQAFDAHS